MGASMTIADTKTDNAHTSGEKTGFSQVRRKGGFQRENANPLSDRPGDRHSF